MANNENDFQKEIVKAIKQIPNGYARRIRTELVGGVPDLFISVPNFSPIWIECKFQRSPSKMTKLTEQQIFELNKLDKSECNSAWLICRKVGTLKWELYGGNVPQRKFEEEHHLLQTRTRGEKWNIKKILKSLTKY